MRVTVALFVPCIECVARRSRLLIGGVSSKWLRSSLSDIPRATPEMPHPVAVSLTTRSGSTTAAKQSRVVRRVPRAADGERRLPSRVVVFHAGTRKWGEMALARPLLQASPEGS